MTAQERFDSVARMPFQTTTSSRTLSGSWRALADIFRHREMLSLLVRRDIKAKYKDSALGLVWTLVRPLTQLAIYYIVLGKFLGAERGIPDFAIYIFAGLTAYSLFSEIVGGGTTSIIANAGLIKKVQLPREVFPLASVGSALFNFVIQLGILVVATIVIGKFPLHWNLLYAIPAVLLLVIFGFALGLMLSALNVYLRDIGYLVEVLLMVLLWASPVLYAWSFVRNAVGEGLLLELYTNNPVTLAIMGFQRAFWTAGADMPYPTDLLVRMGIAGLIGLVLVFFAHRVFVRLQGNFAQEL